jgi:hypothetical protein
MKRNPVSDTDLIKVTESGITVKLGLTYCEDVASTSNSTSQTPLRVVFIGFSYANRILKWPGKDGTLVLLWALLLLITVSDLPQI